MRIIAYLTWSIAHIFSLALMLLCALGIGNLFLSKFRFQGLAERFVFTTSLGLGLCAIVLFLIGVAGMLYQPVIRSLTAAGALATCLSFLYSHRRALGIRDWKQRLSVWRRKDFYTLRRSVIALLALLALAYWFISLITAQYPPIHWDGIAQHLVVAREFLAQHRPVAVLGLPQPVLPALNHILFTWALALQDDSLASMVEHTLYVLTAVGIYACGKRRGQRALGYAAAALWLVHPLVHLLSEGAYVDLALTCFIFLGIYALRIFWDDGDVRWWYLGMALLAFGAGVKLPGMFFLGIAAVLGLRVMIRSYRGIDETESGEVRERFHLKQFLLGGVFALLILIPWYGFVAYHTGNPLWPALAQYSRGEWGSPAIIKDVNALSKAGEKQTLENFMTLSIDWVRHPNRFDAELGQSLFPLIAIWPLAWIVAVFNRSVRWWTLWALAYTVFWFLQAPFLRYWLPVLPIAGIALCESIEWILQTMRVSAAFRNALWVSGSVVLLLWGGIGIYTEVSIKKLPPVTPETRQTFLHLMGGYTAARYVSTHAKNDEAVAVLSASWLNYYFDRRVIDLRGALYQDRKPTFNWPDDQAWMEWLESENANWIVISHKAPEVIIPKRNPVLDPFWPDYELVYSDSQQWIFHRKP